MDREIIVALSNLLDEKLKPIHEDIRELKTDVKDMKMDIRDLKLGQETIINKSDEIESVNATRHTEMMNDISDIKENINDIKFVTACNFKDIVKLQSIK
jgi:regulator of replication initiation timing